MTLTGPFRRQRGKKTESGHLRLLPLDAVSMATWCSRSKIMRWRSVPRPHAHAHSHTTHTSNRRTWFMSKDNCTIFFIYPTQKSVEYITMLLRSKIKNRKFIFFFHLLQLLSSFTLFFSFCYTSVFVCHCFSDEFSSLSHESCQEKMIYPTCSSLHLDSVCGIKNSGSHFYESGW